MQNKRIYDKEQLPALRSRALPPSNLPHRLVREPECHAISGLSRTTRWRLEREGKFPQRRRLSTNSIGWVLAELEDWARARETVNTGPPGGSNTEGAK